MPSTVPSTQVSSYLQYLPAIFQQDADEQGVNFLGRFLLAFEKILSGLDDPDERGLEELIAGMHTYFMPGPLQPGANPAPRAPDDFLPWLASWVGLSLRADWNTEEKRRLLSRIVPLYQQRGTKQGLIDLLSTYTGMRVEINEYIAPLQIGVTATVGTDTYLGGGPAHFFRVKLFLTKLDPVMLSLKEQIARAIIDQEKPAHTYYDLAVAIPTMQIGVNSTVGEDTLLGNPVSDDA